MSDQPVWVMSTEVGDGIVVVQYPHDVELPEGWLRISHEEAARILAQQNEPKP